LKVKSKRIKLALSERGMAQLVDSIRGPVNIVLESLFTLLPRPDSPYNHIRPCVTPPTVGFPCARESA
jgi:hypothetical protein